MIERSNEISGDSFRVMIFRVESTETVVANGDTRAITFQHTHRDDGITVTFKRNGRYDEDGLKKLNFHAMGRDPSMLRERLGYGSFRQNGVAAPRAMHARRCVVCMRRASARNRSSCRCRSKSTPHALGHFPGFVQLFARKTACMADRSRQSCE